MIVSIKKPNVNYRAIDALNSSMIKLFDSDPVKFFKQFKEGKKVKSVPSTSLILGDIVDFYLLDCQADEDLFDQTYDVKFVIPETERGSGQVFMLADELYKITQKDCVDNVINTSFETRFKQAFLNIKATGKYYKSSTEESAMIDFDKHAKSYYEELINSVDKTVVTTSLIDKAKKIAKSIIQDEFTGYLFKDSPSEEVYRKFPIEWEYQNIKCKSELDLIRINHSTKSIKIYDLKTTYDNENFQFTYLKNGYYIQAGFYYLAVLSWAKEHGMEEYKVIPMQFIVCDTSSNERRPIKYQTSELDKENSLNGFKIRGTIYKGVLKIIEEIIWAEQMNVWNCGKEVFENSGNLNLNLIYD